MYIPTIISYYCGSKCGTMVISNCITYFSTYFGDRSPKALAANAKNGNNESPVKVTESPWIPSNNTSIMISMILRMVIF